MKYKLLFTDDDWLPRDGGIKLRKEDSQGQLYGLVGTLKLYNLLQCGTSGTLNGVYKGLLTTGTNCLKRTQQESTVGGMNLLATIGGA